MKTEYIKESLKNVRCAYPHLFKGNPLAPTKHTVKILLPKSDPQTIKLISLFKQMAKTTFGDEKKAFTIGQIQDGDLPNKTGEMPEEFKGHYTINANTKVGNPRFRIVDRARQPIYAEEDIYGGCWLNVNLALNAYTHPKYGAKFAIYLNGVQKVKDDVPFGNGASGMADEFEELPEDDDNLSI